MYQTMPLAVSNFNQIGSNSRWFTGPNFLFNATISDFSEKIISAERKPKALQK